jgi:hypothetical protein
MVKTLSNFKIHLKTCDTWTIGMFPFSRTLTAFPSVVKYFQHMFFFQQLRVINYSTVHVRVGVTEEKHESSSRILHRVSS